MSNNAAKAYGNNRMPKSAWTKKAVLKAYRECEEYEDKPKLLVDILAVLEKAPLKTLKEVCLECTEWHHTSSWYNETDFYSIKAFESSEELKLELAKALEADKKAKEPEKKHVLAKFAQWEGSRRHPKCTWVEAEGYIQGAWFHSDDGKYRKKVSGNWFEIIEGPETELTCSIRGLSPKSVCLRGHDKEGKETDFFYVRLEDLTKALGCRETDLQDGDCVKLKIKPRPKEAFAVLLSAESKDVEERIQDEERGLQL